MSDCAQSSGDKVGTEGVPQLAENKPATVGEQLEVVPDHDFLLNEPNGLVSDFLVLRLHIYSGCTI